MITSGTLTILITRLLAKYLCGICSTVSQTIGICQSRTVPMGIWDLRDWYIIPLTRVIDPP